MNPINNYYVQKFNCEKVLIKIYDETAQEMEYHYNIEKGYYCKLLR